MKSFGEYSSGLAAHLVSTLAPLFGRLGAARSASWAMVVGVIALVIYLGTFRDGWRQRKRHLGITLDGTRIESLNVANVLRRVNQTLVIEEAENTAIISGRDIVISWRCDGYCRADRESAIEFSIDSDNDIPFEQMACFAYDLLRDPKQRHRLRPVLVGPDGPSKKLAVPFLEPLRAQQPFSVLLTWSSPDCMQNRIDYYTVTFSFDQDQVPRCITRLVFLKERPAWVRAYANDVSGRFKLLNELSRMPANAEDTEYRDVAKGVPATSARVYLFERSLRRTPDDVRRAA